jgi:hypothetical protein
MPSSVAVALGCLFALAAAPAAANDEPDELMPGRIVVIREGRFAKFIAKPPTGMSFDLPDATNDPTSEGAELQIFDSVSFNPASNDYLLAPIGWRALGNPPGSRGYKYTGTGSPTDPCRVVLVKATIVKAVCKGPGVTLSAPFSDDVGIVLIVGTDSKRYCAIFGGDSAGSNLTMTRRKNAPAPGACPVYLSPTTTLPPTTSTSSTTSTSTSTSIPGPVPCCAFPSFGLCVHGPMANCASLGGVPGDPGSVCDSVTGACIMTSPGPGNCCDADREPGDELCFAGPRASPEDQCLAPSTYVPNAICSSNTPSVCVTVPSTSTSTSVTTTFTGTITTTSTSSSSTMPP